jgi:hypothetical protein
MLSKPANTNQGAEEQITFLKKVCTVFSQQNGNGKEGRLKRSDSSFSEQVSFYPFNNIRSPLFYY